MVLEWAFDEKVLMRTLTKGLEGRTEKDVEG